MYRTRTFNVVFLLAMQLLCLAAAARGETGTDMTRYSHPVPDSILSQIFKAADVHANRVKDYKGELYLKGRMKVHKRNRIIKYLPSMFWLEKGVEDYIYESISDYHYTAPDLVDRKVRAVSSTFPNARGEIFDIIDYMHSNIYSPSLMNGKLVSPLYSKSSIHYKYVIENVDYERDGAVYKIRITPRYKSTQLLEGVLWFSSSDWTIRYMDLSGSYGLIKFRMTMQMGETAETKFLPMVLNIDLDFKFLGNHLEMNYTGWMKYSEVTFREPDEEIIERKDKSSYDLTHSYTLTTDTTALITDLDSFAHVRPVPLDDDEDSLYIRRDERMNTNEPDTLKEKTFVGKSLVFWGQIGDALISSYNVDMSKIGNISCSPIVNPLLVSYSHRKGISYRQVFKYNKLFHNSQLLRIYPQIGYNFTKKEFYATLDLEYIYNPSRHGSIEINAGNGNRTYSSIVTDQLEQMPDSTFSFDGLDLDYFKDIYVDISHNIEIINGLRLWTGLSIHWRYTKSTPEVEARVRTKYNSFAPRIRLEWTPGMYYYMNGDRKVNVGSFYPTFMVDYERGIRLLRNSGTYERIELGAEQTVKLQNIQSLSYFIGGGLFTDQSDMYFVDFRYFSDVNLPQGWNDDIGGTFQALDSHWYNAASHYIRGNITYEAPFILLYPVNNLLSFIQKERIYAGVLFMPHLNPYMEFGYGFATHIFDAGIFIGNEKGKFSSFGFKFTFELFNK